MAARQRQFERELRHKIEQFVDELTELVREATLDSVANALGGVSDEARAALTAKSNPTKNKRRVRRTGKELGALKQMLFEHIQKSPGQRVEEISRDTGHSTSKLQVPLKQLLEDGKITTSGRKRSTRYLVRS